MPWDSKKYYRKRKKENPKWYEKMKKESCEILKRKWREKPEWKAKRIAYNKEWHSKHKDYAKNWRKKHPEYHTKMVKYYYRKTKLEALKHYSPELKCECCGEHILEFLEIDHVDGGGNAHRRMIKNKNIYVWLKQNHYPPNFQILCSNCNMAKSRYGYCPHQKPRKTSEEEFLDKPSLREVQQDGTNLQKLSGRDNS